MPPSTCDLVDNGYLRAARSAPRCPEIEQHSLSAEIAKRQSRSIQTYRRAVGNNRQRKIRSIVSNQRSSCGPKETR